MPQKHKKILGALLVIALISLSSFIAIKSEFLNAALFGQSGGGSSNIAADVYIPDNFRAGAGQSGEIAVVANTNKSDILGLSFEVAWNPTQATFLDVSQLGTKLHNQGFIVEKILDQNAGTLQIAAIKATGGISFAPNDHLLHLGFRTNSQLSNGTPINFNLNNVQIVTNDLNGHNLSSRGGRVTITDGSGNTAPPPGGGGGENNSNLALRSQQSVNGVVGLSFRAEWNAQQATLINTTLDGTVFNPNTFVLNATQNNPGIVSAAIATGGNGVNVSTNSVLTNFTIELNENLPVGTQVHVRFIDIEFTLGDLNSTVAGNDQTVTLTVSSDGTLQLLQSKTLSKNSIELEFSDFITEAAVNDITITPNLIGANATAQVSGKKVTLKNLNNQTPNTLYRVDIGGVESNAQGGIDPEFSTGFFHGFPNSSSVSPFAITDAAAVSDTSIRVTFSKDVNPLSIELEDFVLSDLEITQVAVGANDRELILTTASQDSLVADTLLRIANVNAQHDLKSTNDELLSQNMIYIVPFNKGSADAPKMTNAAFIQKQNGENALQITFDRALVASSFTGGDVSVYTFDADFIRVLDDATVQFSSDFTTATLAPVDSTAGVLYHVEIANESITAQNGENNESFGSKIVTFGYNTLSDPWNFFLERAEVLSQNQIRLVFSEAIATTPTPVDVAIAHDINGNTANLTVTSVETIGRNMTLNTAVQESGEQYFILVNRNTIRNNKNQPLQAKNSIAVTGFAVDQPRILSISPTSVMNDQDNTVVITGENFSDTVEVTVGGDDVNVESSSSDEITVTIPEGFQAGDWDVQVLQDDGTLLTAPETLLVQAAAAELTVLSEESYASPASVERGQSTTLWVQIFGGARGISDIDKITGDLRLLEGSPSARFTGGDIVDGNTRWFSLNVNIPASVNINAYTIPITAENKSGEKAYGTVSLNVVRENEGNTMPEVISASSNRSPVAPGSSTPFRFTVEVFDADGDDLSQVVLDLTQIGFGPTLLTPLNGGSGSTNPTQDCVESDYILGEWGSCVNGTETRSIELKDGVDCRNTSAIRQQLSQRSCSDTSNACTSDDYQVTPWSPCVDGQRVRTVTKLNDCEEEGTAPAETQSCTTSFLNSLENMLFTPAVAQSAQVSTWFVSEDFTLPNYVSIGDYNLPLTIVDERGGITRSTISFSVNRGGGNVGGEVPILRRDDIFFTPDNTFVQDGKTKYKISVKVTDQNGGDNVEGVVVDLSPLNLGPVAMQRDIVQGSVAYFSISDIIIPKEASPGHNRIEFTVTDEEGHTTEQSVPIQIVTPDEAPGEHNPQVLSDKGYMTPKYVTNNGLETFTLYAFIEDRDGNDDIAYATVNLENVAQFLGATSNPYNPYENIEEENEDDIPEDELNDLFSVFPTAQAVETINKNTNCVTTQNIVCMFPSVSEGANGRWFYLPNLIIPPTTKIPANGDPYELSIVASDSKGRTGSGITKIFVRDDNAPEDNDTTPKLKNAVATESNEVEALFSAPLDPQRVRSDAFRIAEYDNINASLPIQGVAVAPNGRIVTLRTNHMIADHRYVLIVDSEKLGLKNFTTQDNQVEFRGYDRDKNASNSKLSALVAKSIGTKRVSIKFSEDVKFSSLDSDGANFSIYEKDNSSIQLEITSASFGESPRYVVIRTAQQIAGKEYAVQVRDVESVYGNENVRKTLTFKGYTGSSEQYRQLWNQADFNQDGKVDFLDFSLFAAVYGSTETGSPGDINGDGNVDFSDFTAFAALYGTIPPPPPEQDEEESEEELDPNDLFQLLGELENNENNDNIDLFEQ